MKYPKGFKKEYVYIMVQDVARQQAIHNVVVPHRNPNRTPPEEAREEAYMAPTLGDLVQSQDQQTPEHSPQLDKPYTPPSLSDVIKKGEESKNG